MRKCTDNEMHFEDNKRKAFDLTLNEHCTREMKNGIEELTDCKSAVRNDPVEVSKRIKTSVFTPNKSKCECVGIKETIKWSAVDISQKDNKSSLDHTKQFKQAKDVFE